MYIVKTLENIAYGLNHNDIGTDYRDATWDPKSRSEAAAILASITSFDFIVTFLTAYQLLSHLAGITVLLQGKTVDIIKAYKEVSNMILYRYIKVQNNTKLCIFYYLFPNDT